MKISLLLGRHRITIRKPWHDRRNKGRERRRRNTGLSMVGGMTTMVVMVEDTTIMETTTVDTMITVDMVDSITSHH